MTMSNQEYLEAYETWKDQVNTEDQDTPERFAYHLKNLENERVLKEIRALVSDKLDELDPAKDQPGVKDRMNELLAVAQLAGLDTSWWAPPVKLQALAERPSPFMEE